MKISTILASVILVCVSSIAFTPLRAEQGNSESRPKIQIAILLDTSSSMTGLIDQARKHLWTIVNQFIDADFKGQEPLLEVALLEYGAGRLDADAGYTRLVVPLTTNLDQVYEDLVQLTAVGRPGGSLESLPYGDREARRASITRQVQQDETAAALAASSSADRIRFKGSALYRNEGWDLIDGVKNGRVELSKLKDDQLPESLRKMTLEERDAHVKELTQQRAKLQAEIKALSQKRDKFLETQAQDAARTPVNRFDQALIEAVKQQSEKQGIKLKK